MDLFCFLYLEEEMNRVKFYSVTDLGSGHQLKKAEKVINNFDKNKEYKIEDILEFYNITKYIDRKMYLEQWNKEYIEEINKIIKEMRKKIFKYIDDNVNEEKFEEIIKGVPNEYMNDFFELIEKKILNIDISGNTFIQSIDKRNVPIYYLLEYQKIVKKYDNELRLTMLENILESAEILIKKYYIKDEKCNNWIIPSTLTLQDKEYILQKYIDNEYANLNYLRIITKIQSNKDTIIIKDKTKLKARKKVIEMENKIFKNGIRIGYTYNVLFDSNQIEEKVQKLEGTKIVCSYSKKWIEENKDDFATLLNNFIYLFEFVDIEGRIELVNKKHEYGLFEKVTNSNILRAYNPNSTFNHKKILSLLKINAYYEQLNKLNIRLEDIIEWFFEIYLKENFKIENYSVSMPTKGSSYFEKCKSILPEIDHILKEYKYYIEDGCIDPELISLSSEHMFFKDIPSKIKNKYVYLKEDDENNYIDYCFFSDQCMLSYLENVEEKYDSFFKLILKENIKYNDYPEYEKNDLNWLLEHRLIKINEEGFLKINNKERISIYAELHYKEVINYWKKPLKVKNEINKMINEGKLEFESTLFSRNEQDYFNYYLNMSEFIDGYDIRNSNLHGTQIGDRKSDIHYSRYLQILLLIILIVIKINDDICLSESENIELNQN